MDPATLLALDNIPPKGLLMPPSKRTTLQIDDTISTELSAAGNRDAVVKQTDKKNYAERLSRALAQRFANELRHVFPGILPDVNGKGQESRARSAKGFKKLDVNYSTTELGLGLGISVKTLNFSDGKSKRYTKNYTRVDGELRAEASDYHERQPYAVMVAAVFLPIDCCDDKASDAPSSFGKAVQTFRFRAGRTNPDGPEMLFEKVYIGLYDTSPERFGTVGFFDVMDKPPKHGRPAKLLTMREMLDGIVRAYDGRNSPQFEWADAEPETVSLPPAETDLEDGRDDEAD